MLRWLTVFGAVALVAIGVVFYVYKGPPDFGYLIQPPPTSVPMSDPAGPKDTDKQALAKLPEQPGAAAAGPWSRVVAVTPLVVISDARLTALQTPQVPAMRDGQLAFLGSEVAVKEGEKPPAGAFKQEVNYLVIEAQPGEQKQDDWVVIGGKWYRPLTKRDELKPNHMKLFRTEKWFLPVDEGTIVKEGQMLAMIDPVTAVDDLAIKLSKFDAAEADRAAEEKQRDEYMERWKRADKLYRTGAGSYEDMTAAKLAYDYHVYETIHKNEDLKVAGNELRQAQTLLDLYMVRSKISGQVKQVLKHPGEGVKSAPAFEGVVEMTDYSKLRIRGRVDLQDLPNLPDPRNPLDKRVLYVEAKSLVPPQRVLTGHFDAVTGVAISKDGQIVSVSEDRTARVWEKDPAHRRERLVRKQPAAIRAVACSPAALENKNLFLTGAADGIARLYDLSAEGNAFVRNFDHGHKEAINCVAFSPDGRWAVTGGEDRAICLWDVESGEQLQKKPIPGEWGHKAGVSSVSFLAVGPEKKLSVVSAGRDGALIVWPLSADGAPEKPLKFDRRFGEVQTLGVNPKGGQLLFDQGKDLRVVSAENGSLLGSLSATGGSSFSKLALFSPEGNLVLTSTGAGRLQLWRAPTEETRGYELEHLIWTAGRDEQANTNCGAFAPDSSFLVTGTQNRNVIVWPMPSKEVIERRLTAKIVNLAPEVTSGQVGVTAELDNKDFRLLPGDSVSLVVYPEK
jgi:WD40 repeat protein